MGNACGCVEKNSVKDQDVLIADDRAQGTAAVTKPHHITADIASAKQLSNPIDIKDMKNHTKSPSIDPTSASKNKDSPLHPNEHQITSGQKSDLSIAGNKPLGQDKSNGKVSEPAIPDKHNTETTLPPATVTKKDSHSPSGPQPTPLKEEKMASPPPPLKIPSPKNQFVKNAWQSLGKFEPLEKAKDVVKKLVSPGIYYEGQESGGKKHGIGRIIYEQGPIIEGNFSQDVFEGEGRLIKDNGDIYKGFFKQGKAEGKGQYIKKDGETYDGTFKADKPHGQGILKYANGNKYEGNFVDGVKEGKGTLTLANKDVYNGEFKAGEFHGKGSRRVM